jgi:hypothetical protein
MSTIRFVYTNLAGNITDITKTVPDTLDEWFYPLREILLGCGFDLVNVETLMPEEVYEFTDAYRAEMERKDAPNN